MVWIKGRYKNYILSVLEENCDIRKRKRTVKRYQFQAGVVAQW